MTARRQSQGERARTESLAGQRLQSAGARASDAYARVTRAVDRLCEEMDEVTPPLGTPKVEIHDEDSLVTSVAEAIAANSK